MVNLEQRVFVFAIFSFVATTANRVLMSRTTDPRIVADGLGVLIPMPDRLVCSIDDLGLFPINYKIGFGPCGPMSRSVVGS